MQQDIESNKT